MTTIIARDLLKTIRKGGTHILTEARLTFGPQQEFIASGPVEVNSNGETGLTNRMQATEFDLAAINRASTLREDNLYGPNYGHALTELMPKDVTGLLHN